jgi:hypothetical protein
LPSSCCSNGSRQRNAPRSCCAKPSTTHIEIFAEVLHLEEANARQLVTRARQHVADGRRARVSNAEQRRLLQAFIAAAQAGDLAEFDRLFTADVVSMSDGGGFIRAAEKPVVGRERVAKYIATVSGWAWSGVTVSLIQANGQACALMLRNGVVVMLFTIGASPEGWVMRPSKLTGVAASSSAHHLPLAATDLEPDRATSGCVSQDARHIDKRRTCRPSATNHTAARVARIPPAPPASRWIQSRGRHAGLPVQIEACDRVGAVTPLLPRRLSWRDLKFRRRENGGVRRWAS